ncbi:DUF3558 domain-containing protein [Actinomycetospora aeridis]|uniref:DUF3558 domain-containing protein n=1 Tax=Actinomycetospora aeridis TaxID=3129231 RepID=UPI0035A145B6
MNRSLAAIALVVAVLVVGCSSQSPEPSPAPAPDRFGAPVPPRSLDGTAHAARPCSLLDSSELRQFGLEANGRVQQLPYGSPACVWSGPGFSREVSVAVVVDRDYLVDTYRSRPTYQVFEPITIDGLPAVAQQTTPTALTCTVTTGIALGQAVDVSSTEFGSQPSPPCETARRVTEVVVSSLPPVPTK